MLLIDITRHLPVELHVLVAIALPLQIHGEDKRMIIPSHTIQGMPAVQPKLNYTAGHVSSMALVKQHFSSYHVRVQNIPRARFGGGGGGGLVGFWKVMNCIGNCFEIAFTIIDDADILQKIDGARLKISICVRKDSSSSWTPLGVELVKGGLSFLTPISRKSVVSGFIDAEQFAKDNKVGLNGIATGEFMHDKLLPFKLKTEDLPKTFKSRKRNKRNKRSLVVYNHVFIIMFIITLSINVLQVQHDCQTK